MALIPGYESTDVLSTSDRDKNITRETNTLAYSEMATETNTEKFILSNEFERTDTAAILLMTDSAVTGSSASTSETSEYRITNVTGHIDRKFTWVVQGCSASVNTTAKSGEIFWSYNQTSVWRDECLCMLDVHVAEGLYIVANVELIQSEQCSPLLEEDAPLLLVFDQWPVQTFNPDYTLQCMFAPHFQKIYTRTNNVYFPVQPSCSLHTSRFTIRFRTTNTYTGDAVHVVTSSPSTGYVTSPGYDGISYAPPNLDITYVLNVPVLYLAVMVSFSRLHFYSNEPCFTFLELFIMNTNASFSSVWQRCTHVNLSADVYLTSALKLYFYSGPFRHSNTGLGFVMRYSFHKSDVVPKTVYSGLFNCSVDYYSSFKQHLDCNTETECHDGQDETEHCPYSSPACAGKVATGRKCLSAVRVNIPAGSRVEDWNRPCQSRGGNLAVIQTQEDMDAVTKLLSFGKNGDRCDRYGLGLVFNQRSLPLMYSKMWTDVNKAIVYDLIAYRSEHSPAALMVLFHVLSCQTFHVHSWRKIVDRECANEPVCGVVCENWITDTSSSTDSHDVPHLNISHRFPQWNVASRLPSLVVCSSHITHLFQSCNSQCDQTSDVTTCAFPAASTILQLTSRRDKTRSDAIIEMFVCDDGHETVHFSLVCNFHYDCSDQSDEFFCKHPECQEQACSNGQCMYFSGRCDDIMDCQDKSDEDDCFNFKMTTIQVDPRPIRHALINLDGRGYFTFTPLQWNESCPDTHFRCPGEPHNCLPVYTRCNGYYDCVGREDEQGCDNVTCPGYYRCRGSSICVHLDHLCDGWPQCPQHDDEWLCDEKPCPSQCLCQGLSFVCSQPFSTDLYPSLKYLDGRGSGITPTHLSVNTYLIYLSLVHCNITNVAQLDLLNLKYLDMANNKLESIKVNDFLPLQNLKFLSLADNPLSNILIEPSSVRQRTLRSIDLSRTNLNVFSSKPLSSFLTLQFLNVSHSSIRAITDDGFQYIPTLLQLDISATPLNTFTADVFHGVEKLEKITSSTYKLCCRSILPKQFDEQFCLAPPDEISSCDDLLRSELYRGFLWLMSILAITGNTLCLVFRSLVQRMSTKSAFNLFVTCLSLADLVMGVYVTIIGCADLMFRGGYVNHDIAWINSEVCTLAGVLSLLSSEVSALSILLITLDRFIVIHIPFSNLRFKNRSATVACVLVWLVGILLAVVPLLPQTADWNFYRQSGICIPLPITRKDFSGRIYSYGVMIILNFVLFVLIAAGQALIYWSVRKHSVALDSNRKCKDATIARRLLTVAVTDFLCWFPIGLLGLLAFAGIPIPGEVNVAMAIFVLPLNSAFNPFLYTLNVILEKRRRQSEERLMKVLESTLSNT